MIRASTTHAGQHTPTTRWQKSRLGATLLASLCITCGDYRLTPNGLIFGVLSLLSLASAGLLYHKREHYLDIGETTHKRGLTLPMIVIPLGIAAICYGLSDKASTSVLDSHQRLILCVNVMSSATSYVVALRLLTSDMATSISGYTLFALVGFAALVSRVLGVTSYVSPLQLIAFGIASVCTSERLIASESYGIYGIAAESEENFELVGIANMSVASTSHQNTSGILDRGVHPGIRRPGEDWAWLTSAILLVLTVATWMFSLQRNFFAVDANAVSSMVLRLDRDYRPTSELDIVVSMFRESPSDIKKTVDRLRQLPEIAPRDLRLIIYTKDPSADIDILLEQTGATSVVQLPNVGREGHTYLHHIVERWGDLAAQTFFLQADIHNPREFFPRVRDYYTLQTGMLSLGFSGRTCDCKNCGDRFGWWDNTLVPEVWSQVMNETCTDQQILLSYKGQFVASAARLRGNELSLYQTLKTAMEDPEDPVHRENYLQGRLDSMNAPFFGYTLERLWSVILQCSEERIARRCPTLLSGTLMTGPKENCQCFDVL